jgi:predicted dehydrogenase
VRICVALPVYRRTILLMKKDAQAKKDPMSRIRFGVVGTGWRTEFYLRVARARPDLFEVAGVVSRTAERADAVHRQWGVPGLTSLDTLLAAKPEYVVTSVPWPVNPGLLRELAERRMPALSETPPAPDLESLLALDADLTRLQAQVQVAEEYHLRPSHAAQLAFVADGRLGPVSHAQVSIGHGYHGISLIRRFLGIKGESCKLVGRSFRAPIVAGGGRNGVPTEETVRESVQDVVLFDFGDRTAVFDFTGDQYMGMIRDGRVLVRGPRGELSGDSIRYLKDAATPIHLQLTRHHQDLLTGVSLRGIQAGDDWIYRNPLAGAALTDDEIAVGDCLLRMAAYVRTGRSFYPWREGMQDHYLYLRMQEALRTGAEVSAPPQSFSEFECPGTAGA